ncbi:NAD(P)/FAD-dependent oxidoreductase [Moorella sulfitireducens]|uniref:NAD(P)/FAD-dependent oxidoreductase n=1 Tax=Neomoorella sulfitireducens TaxID=2972948 RepID=UPI0021ACB9B7|nr:hypothetical protein [Moorella sulfitireducens]
MPGGNIVGFLERCFSRRPPRLADLERTGSRHRATRPLVNGDRVIVIGGGIAGSAFARQLLLLARRENLKIKVYLVNSTNCNYCGGLITDLALNTMRSFLRLDLPEDVVLQKVERCIYVNVSGHVTVELNTPLNAVLRTSRFGVTGFDDSLKLRILEGLSPEIGNMLEIFEPTVVKRIYRQEKETGWRVIISRRHESGSFVELEGDVLVMAAGFRSLGRPMLQSFIASTGYEPPPIMAASVTEIDTSSAKKNLVGNNMFILDNILPGAVLALIPKSKDWLTLTSLGRHLTKEEVDQVLSHPGIRQWLELPEASKHLRCQLVCGAQVFTGPSRRFYGDRWVVIGDLAGYGRVLKDGYFASFLGSRLAAATMVYHGISERDFARFYHAPLKNFILDNRVGMWLFKVNNFLNRSHWFSHLFMAAGQQEGRSDSYGGFVHSGVRSLVTGELSYRLTALLFIAGITYFALTHPGELQIKLPLDRGGIFG